MNTKLIIILLVFASFSGSAQEKTYLDADDKVTTAELASHYETVEYMTDSLHKIVRDYSLEGWMISETTLLKDPEVWDGKMQLFNKDGSVAFYINYKDGKRDGDSKTYYSGGKIKTEEIFDHDQLVSGRSYDENGTQITYTSLEKVPQYPGGVAEAYKYVANNFHLKGTATGIIIVTFIVEKDGSVTEVKIKKSLNKRMDKEAIRVVESMPKWTPGEQNGRKVRAVFTLPIKIAQQ